MDYHERADDGSEHNGTPMLVMVPAKSWYLPQKLCEFPRSSRVRVYTPSKQDGLQESWLDSI